MRDIALDYLYDQDAFAAIEYLCQQPDPLTASKTFADLVRHLYWEKKDTHRMIAMAQAGIQFGLMAAIAHDAHDANMAAQLRSSAKGLAYDLGSFTWLGWDEPGIVLEEEHLRFGREAAKINLRLAHLLNKGDLPLSRAYWLLGAHDLAAGESETAYNHFAEASRYAQSAGASEAVLLNEGYQCLASLLASADETRHSDFMAIQTSLASTADGVGLAEQLKTAWKVFASPKSEFAIITEATSQS